ncbi:MAG: hypothetical protein WC569_04825 [Candidatus Omnitrophota bacterium]
MAYIEYNLHNMSSFKKVLSIFLLACLLAGSAAYAAVVGTVKDSEKSWYAVFNMGNDQKKLCVKGDIFYSKTGPRGSLRVIDIQKGIVVLRDVDSKDPVVLNEGERVPLGGADVFFEKTVESDVIEYRYKTAKKLTRDQVEDFTVKDLDKKKIILEKRRVAESGGLKTELFDRIETSRIEEDTWAIDRKSTRPAFYNAGSALLSVIKGVEPGYKHKEGASLKLDSELGVFVLNRDGFLVKDLASSRITENFGIKEGDVIKSVNGHEVRTLLGIYRVYESIKGNRKLSAVNVDIMRNGRLKRLNYTIK